MASEDCTWKRGLLGTNGRREPNSLRLRTPISQKHWPGPITQHKAATEGQQLDKKDAVKHIVGILAQTIQSWARAQNYHWPPTTRLPNYKGKRPGSTPNHSDPAPASTTVEPKQNPPLSPFEQALRGEQQWSSMAFDPPQLLVIPGSTIPWLELTWDLHQCSLQPLVHKLGTWTQHQTRSCQTHHGCRKRWQDRPDDAETTMTRSSKFLPLPFLNKVLKQTRGMPSISSSITLGNHNIRVLTFLTPFTLSSSIRLFFRLMMFLTPHQPHSNSKLKTLLRGTTIIHYFHGTTLSGHIQFSQPFYFQNTVYIRFTHKRTDQPRFYIGSTTNKTFDREPIRFRKFKLVQQGQLVLSEVAVLGSQPAILRVEYHTHIYPKIQTLRGLSIKPSSNSGSFH